MCYKPRLHLSKCLSEPSPPIQCLPWLNPVCEKKAKPDPNIFPDWPNTVLPITLISTHPRTLKHRCSPFGSGPRNVTGLAYLERKTKCYRIWRPFSLIAYETLTLLGGCNAKAEQHCMRDRYRHGPSVRPYMNVIMYIGLLIVLCMHEGGSFKWQYFSMRR